MVDLRQKGDGEFICGAIFVLDKEDASINVLHVFNNITDGCDPQSAMTEASPGVFYGTTAFGGPDNAGSVYMFTVN